MVLTALISAETGSANRAPKACIVAIAGLLLAAPAQAQLSGAERALQLVKAMSDYMTSQQSVSGRFDIDIDVVTPEIEKIQFSSTGNLVLARPDRIHVIRQGGNIDLNLFFDGKTVTLVDKGGSAYAQIASPGSIEPALKRLKAEYAVEAPVTDVLLANSFDTLMTGVRGAKYLGKEMIGGVECEHLFFRSTETDWQLWVRSGDQPIPCKYVISSKTVAASPQYTIRYHDWAFGQPAAATAFSFAPAASAKLVGFDKISSESGLLATTAAAPELTGEP